MSNSQLVLQQGINFADTQQFNTMQRAAKMFASSEVVPDMFRAISGKRTESQAMANVMIALDMAGRMNTGVLAVMQNMYIVYGKPAFSSAFLIASINSCGRYETLKYRFAVEGKIEVSGKKIDNLTCVAWTRERGSEQVLESTKISLEMAVSEGWYTKSGSKWKTMPQQMLMYRAASFWCRAYAPEISMGMPHTIEEITDTEYEIVTEQAPAEPKADQPSAAADPLQQAIAQSEVKAEPQPQAQTTSNNLFDNDNQNQ